MTRLYSGAGAVLMGLVAALCFLMHTYDAGLIVAVPATVFGLVCVGGE